MKICFSTKYPELVAQGEKKGNWRDKGDAGAACNYWPGLETGIKAQQHALTPYTIAMMSDISTTRRCPAREIPRHTILVQTRSMACASKRSLPPPRRPGTQDLRKSEMTGSAGAAVLVRWVNWVVEHDLLCHPSGGITVAIMEPHSCCGTLELGH